MNLSSEDSVRLLWQYYADPIYSLMVEQLGPYKKLRRQLVDVAPNYPDTMLVDAGCGTGAIIEEFIKRGHVGRVVGVDREEAFLNAARRRFNDVSNVKLFELDLDRPGALGDLLGGAPVRGIFSNNSLYAWKDPARNLREFCEILEPGGWLLINNLYRPVVQQVLDEHRSWLESEASEEERQYFRDFAWAFDVMVTLNEHIGRLAQGGTFHLWSPDRLVDEVESAGFKVDLSIQLTYAGTACLVLAHK